MTFAHLESFSMSKQNNVEMFIPIFAIFVDQLGQQQPNNLIRRYCLIISLKVVSCRTSVPKQKMSGKDFDGFINKMGTLVANQSERATKFGQNGFINELNCDHSRDGL